eukprot:9371877-Alexandrium_andersonii.AAC.1
MGWGLKAVLGADSSAAKGVRDRPCVGKLCHVSTTELRLQECCKQEVRVEKLLTGQRSGPADEVSARGMRGLPRLPRQADVAAAHPGVAHSRGVGRHYLAGAWGGGDAGRRLQPAGRRQGPQRPDLGDVLGLRGPLDIPLQRRRGPLRVKVGASARW